MSTETERLHAAAVARGETVGNVPTWAEYARKERKERNKAPAVGWKRAVILEWQADASAPGGLALVDITAPTTKEN